MSLNKPKNTFRIVGNARQVMTLWYNGGRYVVPDDDPSYLQKIKDLKIDEYVKTTIAFNVIDRDDQEERKEQNLRTRFKILEKGPKIYEPILSQYEDDVDEETGKKINPGSIQHGRDWVVKTQIKGSGDNRNVDYSSVMPKANRSPLTKEELDVLRRGKNVKEEFQELPLGEKGLIDLDILYGNEKAKEKLNKLFESLGESTSVSAATKEDTSSSFDDLEDDDFEEEEYKEEEIDEENVF